MTAMPGKQFIRFLLAGGVAAAANYGSRFAFSAVLPYGAAIACAYAVGMVVAFALMRQYVFFAGGERLAPQVARFVAVNALALLQTLVVSLLLAHWLRPFASEQQAEGLAHLAGVVVPVFTSFLGHRHATFRRS
jgi:putative flippase GtrA